jgi:hypothetical protein
MSELTCSVLLCSLRCLRGPCHSKGRTGRRRWPSSSSEWGNHSKAPQPHLVAGPQPPYLELWGGWCFDHSSTVNVTYERDHWLMGPQSDSAPPASPGQTPACHSGVTVMNDQTTSVPRVPEMLSVLQGPPFPEAPHSVEQPDAEAVRGQLSPGAKKGLAKT